MYTYTYTYAFTIKHTDRNMFAYEYIYIHIYLYIYVHLYTHMHIRIHRHGHACIRISHVYIYLYINVYIYVCIRACILWMDKILPLLNVTSSLEQTPRPCLTLVRNPGKRHLYEWPQSCTTQMLINVNVKKGVRGAARKVNTGLLTGGARFRPSTDTTHTFKLIL